MQNLTPEGLRMVAGAAERHGVSLDAALALLGALAEGNGRQAQFNHPDFGGMGQWSQGGMIMVGDMFNHGLKARVDALCNELAGLLHSQPSLAAAASQSQSQGQSGGVSLFVAGSGSGSQWWPPELGSPASTGAQNDLQYAFFPGPRRLAIRQDGSVRVYDTGEHRLSGFSQQQSGDRSLTFTSQFGLVRVADLQLVHPPGDRARDQPPQAQEPARPAASVAASAAAPPAPLSPDDILKTIERLAELRRKDIITEAEFSAKKAELLARL
ncbi:MAG TPA: SHOCT domain-containing protein [Roseiarcus sp.]|nr:SHOCT domain-containing protein [Roseiarcus sp.]